MPSGEYNCGKRPLNTTRSNPDITPLTTKVKRRKKVFIGAPEFRRKVWSLSFLFSGHRISRVLTAAQPRCASVVHCVAKPKPSNSADSKDAIDRFVGESDRNRKGVSLGSIGQARLVFFRIFKERNFSRRPGPSMQ